MMDDAAPSPGPAEYLTSPLLAGAAHGFCTRRGGVSAGVLASLNCGLGSGEDPATVNANRARARDAIAPGAELLGVYQYHSPAVRIVDESWGEEARPKADALVTRLSGIALSILTADCAPILFYDPKAQVIGAAHAGWRGAQGQVIAASIAAMETLGAERGHIRAAIGPCIAARNYEVGPDMRARFGADEARFFAPIGGAGDEARWHFDLPAYAMSQLAALGLAASEWLGRDTYSEAESFYSYRRATHRGEASYGRQISIIALAN